MNRTVFTRAELVERIYFSPDYALMRFRPEQVPSFRAGQYATLALEDGDQLIQRAYSIVSSPVEPFLEFFIELVPGGALTRRLWELKPGDHALVRKRMAGTFVLAEEEGVTNHLMVATVTGVAPYISIARTLAAEIKRGQPARHRLAILHGASRSADWGVYGDELSLLAREGWLDYVPTVSRPWEDTGWGGETGRVEDVLRKHTDRLGLTHPAVVAYLCGHPQMIENAKGILKRARFPDDRLREERFFAMPDE